MKPLSIAIVFSAILCVTSFALDQTKLESFKSSLEAALKAKDIQALPHFFYTKGASRYQIDSAIHTWEEDSAMYAFEKLETCDFDKSGLAPKPLKLLVEGETMNGHVYVPNLKPIILCKVTFAGKDGAGSANTFVLGVDPDGDFKITLEIPKE